MGALSAETASNELLCLMFGGGAQLVRGGYIQSVLTFRTVSPLADGPTSNENLLVPWR